MSLIETALTEILARSNFPSELGIRFVSAGPGYCLVAVPSQPKIERPGGIMAGYVLVAAADIAAWLAIKTLLEPNDDSVTSDLHTAFVRAAAGDVTCRADVIRCGKRLITVGATTFDATGQTLARHTVTYARRTPGHPPR